MEQIFWMGIGFLVLGLMGLARGRSSLAFPGVLTGVLLLIVFIFVVGAQMAFARDPGGRYAQSDPKMHAWFDSLKSKKGPCCSDADGTALSDVDWESQDKTNSHYRVRLEKQWVDVPDEAVLTQPNLYGRTMVWPIYTRNYGGVIKEIEIRCFIPGVMM